MIKNPVLDNAPSYLGPGAENRCIGCALSFWRVVAKSGLHCYCTAMSAESWSSSRGSLHGVRSCSGRDDDTIFSDEMSLFGDEAQRTACATCENALWWSDDEKKLFCFCSKMYKMVFGVNRDGDRIKPVKTCNGTQPVYDSLDEQEEDPVDEPIEE